MADPVFRQAKSALEQLSADPEARMAAERRETALHLYHVDMIMARKEGMRAIVIQQLTLKFGALPDAIHARLEHATEAELQKLGARVLSASSVDAVFDD